MFVSNHRLSKLLSANFLYLSFLSFIFFPSNSGKIPKLAFGFQNMVFRLLPKSVFEAMAFDKKDTFALGSTMKNLNLSSKAAQVGCPTLVLCGEKDSANRKSAHLLAQTIKNAELKIVANTGHVVNEENPKALAEILNEYYLKNP